MSEVDYYCEVYHAGTVWFTFGAVRLCSHYRCIVTHDSAFEGTVEVVGMHLVEFYKMSLLTLVFFVLVMPQWVEPQRHIW